MRAVGGWATYLCAMVAGCCDEAPGVALFLFTLVICSVGTRTVDYLASMLDARSGVRKKVECDDGEDC
jgi:hypothetical protein